LVPGSLVDRQVLDERVLVELQRLGFPKSYITYSILNSLFNLATASYWVIQKRNAGTNAVMWTSFDGLRPPGSKPTGG
jgi:hypothetical protein